jgi:hypothetical protein
MLLPVDNGRILDTRISNSVGTHIARVADAVAKNGDSCVVRVVLFQLDFPNTHGVAYFLPLVKRDIVVVNTEECVGTGNTFGVGGLP